jgi:predicted chitinase
MDYSTLIKSQLGYLSTTRAKALVGGCNEAMNVGHINTVNRAAMFLAQIGHESGSLRYKQEIAPAPGAPYWPYIGRTFIQVTWKYNYLAFGEWCHARGLLSNPTSFVMTPSSLAADHWAWLGAVWFWTTHGLNTLADNRDIYGATQRINGGYNGLQDRMNRWHHCLSLGNAILPTVEGPHVRRPWPSYMAPYHYYGLISGPEESHGGYVAGERKDVSAIQQRLAHYGFKTTDPLGFFRKSTQAQVIAWQHKYFPSTHVFGRIAHNDWNKLFYY